MGTVFTYELAKALMNNSMEELDESARGFQEMMMMYTCALKEIRTKIEVLSEEFQVKSQRNPIESIKTRLKKPMSIFDKARRKGIELTFESVRENLNDIAGVRVICPFIQDIYAVAEMLTNQDDIKMLEIKDYIQHPKENGYRSLHVVVEVPIFLSDRKEYIKVEVQIRTIAMDFWAALEHQIHYKKHDESEDKEIVAQLKECADTIFDTDKKMEAIRRKLAYVEELDHII